MNFECLDEDINKAFDKIMLYTFDEMINYDDFIVIYNSDDDVYELHPHYEFNDFNDQVSKFKNNDTGKIFDEHGKLKSVFSVEYKDSLYKIKAIKFKPKTDSMFFSKEYKTIEINIEDYKLKCLINRYISIIECVFSVEPVKSKYGSTDMSHLLWMLHEIYTQKRSLMERYMFLGYIQGILSSKNLINVCHERDIMHEIL